MLIVFNVTVDTVGVCLAHYKCCKILSFTKRIICKLTNSIYQVLSAEAYTKHGLNISGVVFDELHAQLNRNLFDVIMKGRDNRLVKSMRLCIKYDTWKKLGLLQATEENVIDHGVIEDFISQLSERFNIAEIASDCWNATF